VGFGGFVGVGWEVVWGGLVFVVAFSGWGGRGVLLGARAGFWGLVGVGCCGVWVGGPFSPGGVGFFGGVGVVGFGLTCGWWFLGVGFFVGGGGVWGGYWGVRFRVLWIDVEGF